MIDRQFEKRDPSPELSSSLDLGLTSQQYSLDSRSDIHDENEKNRIGLGSAINTYGHRDIHIDKNEDKGILYKIDSKLIGNTSSIDDEESKKSGLNSIEKNEINGGGRRFTMPVNMALEIIRNPYQCRQNEIINEMNTFASRPGSCGSDVLRNSPDDIETSKNIFLSKNYDDIFHDYNKKLSKSSKLKQKKERKERGYLLDQFNKREFGNTYDETDRINIGNKYGKKLWLRKSNKTEDLITNRRKSSALVNEFDPNKTSELFVTTSNPKIISRSPSFQFMKSGVNIIDRDEDREEVEKDKKGEKKEEKKEKMEVVEEMNEKEINGEKLNYHRNSVNFQRAKTTEGDDRNMRQRAQALKGGKGASSRSAHFRNLGLKSVDVEFSDSNSHGGSYRNGNNNNNNNHNDDDSKNKNDDDDNNNINHNDDSKNKNNDDNNNNKINHKLFRRNRNSLYVRKLSSPSTDRSMKEKNEKLHYNDEEKEKKKKMDKNKFMDKNVDFNKFSDISLSLESETETSRGKKKSTKFASKIFDETESVEFNENKIKSTVFLPNTNTGKLGIIEKRERDSNVYNDKIYNSNDNDNKLKKDNSFRNSKIDIYHTSNVEKNKNENILTEKKTVILPRYFHPTKSTLNSASSSPALLTRSTRMEIKKDNYSPDKQSHNHEVSVDGRESSNGYINGYNNSNDNNNSNSNIYDNMNAIINEKGRSRSYHNIERSKSYSNRSHIPFGGRSFSPSHLPKATSISTSNSKFVMTPVSLPTSPYDTQFEIMRVTNTDVPPNAGLALWGNPTVNGNDSVVSVKDINGLHENVTNSPKPFFS